jgi:putative tryptophan/tyrosine transport system substrate-binding protein
MRRSVSLAGGIGLFVVHRLGFAQPATTRRRVGMLASVSEIAAAPLYAAFRQGMLDLGWLEGTNIEYRYAYADGDASRLDTLAGELIAQKVDAIVVGTSSAAQAAQRATKTIPIVALGIVASLAEPGGNITGTSSQGEEVLAKLIEILHEVTPGARRIAILVDVPSGTFWAAAQSACAALGLVAIRVTASTPGQFGAAVEEIVRQRAQAVVVTVSPLYFNERAKLQAVMQTTRLPVAYPFREHVDAGGLLSYAADLAANFRYAAKYMDKILKGANPANLPIEQPTKFELAVNLKTAKSLGITIPRAVLLRADEMIQ